MGVFIAKTPWWLFIKPLGCLFSKNVMSKGKTLLMNNKIETFNGERYITYKFLGVPYWDWITTSFSEEDKRKRAGLDE